MSWTMGNRKCLGWHLLDGYLVKVGRALLLASAYEQVCLHLLSVFKLEQEYERCGDALEARDAALAVIQGIKTVGPALKQIGGTPYVSEKALAILDRARVARNWIAHDSARIGGLTWRAAGHPLSADLEELEARLRQEVRHLAEGEGLIGAWFYEMNEKEWPYFYDTKSHQDAAEAWVMEGYWEGKEPTPGTSLMWEAPPRRGED